MFQWLERHLEEIEPHYKDQKEFQIILENAELYIQRCRKIP